ncbi:hypothetical protein RHSIM_Rhsim10G0167500 [Rhododendron simsii]|uniref:Uncharacterized protein n=1 Tax=Rhododendron simsii TaxID=118357 RepID=A0A834GFP6_RHOSS|nr:hypothetical protein RHSIM_Rhsim10G0167500 [Rhododendron simsii]
MASYECAIPEFHGLKAGYYGWAKDALATNNPPFNGLSWGLKIGFAEVRRGPWEGTGGGNNGLSKSRSVAFVANAAGRKKKGGFWSKLLRLPGKRTKEAFGHSRNFKEGFEYYNY